MAAVDQNTVFATYRVRPDQEAAFQRSAQEKLRSRKRRRRSL